MNSEKIRVLADYISAYPELYDQTKMGSLYQYTKEIKSGEDISGLYNDYDDEYDPCETAGCLLGWCEVAFYNHEDALELIKEESDLLFDSYWPTFWAEKYLDLTLSDLDVIVSSGLSTCKEPYFNPTDEQAVLMLRKFADLGYVPCE